MKNHTDLAVESFESQEKSKIDGVIVEDNGNATIVRVTNQNGAQALNKPIGNYVTLCVKSFANDADIFDGRLDMFAKSLKSLLPCKINSVLVAGLGNENITADALGPKTNDFVLSTRHIKSDIKDYSGLDDLFCVSTISTGVLGQTGIEACEIIKGVVKETNPDCVIVVDALASSSMDRLGTTIQFSDTGIVPGSGVGNHRNEISKSTLNVPVISIGIPTVVSTGVIKNDDDNSVFLTPREIDKITEQGAKLIGMGINVCFQDKIDVHDLFALVG